MFCFTLYFQKKVHIKQLTKLVLITSNKTDSEKNK